ncbi:MAG: YncE family protein [Terracidiphilus sp.]
MTESAGPRVRHNRSGCAPFRKQARRLLPAAGLLAFALAGCRPHDFPQYPPNYREYVYVTNGDSDTVSIYDVVNVRLDRELAVGVHPVAVLPGTSRNEVYVVNEGAPGTQGSVSVINAETNTVAATIPVRRQPVAIALGPKDALAYVANAGSNNISVLDLKARREVAVIGAGEEPAALRVSPDGKSLVVANRRSGSVSIIDPAARTVRAAFPGCPGAADVVILPDSSKTFAACSAGHQVMAIALARSDARPEAQPAKPDRIESMLDVGRAPVQLALKPDGGELFTMNSLSDSISEVVTGTNDVGGAYLIGANPVRGIVSADNALLYVGNLRSQWVTIYSIDDGRRIPDSQGGSIHVGDGPSALAFSAAGHLLFVVDTRSADVAVVRTATRSLFTVIPAGRAPNAIADKAFKLP